MIFFNSLKQGLSYQEKCIVCHGAMMTLNVMSVDYSSFLSTYLKINIGNLDISVDLENNTIVDSKIVFNQSYDYTGLFSFIPNAPIINSQNYFFPIDRICSNCAKYEYSLKVYVDDNKFAKIGLANERIRRVTDSNELIINNYLNSETIYMVNNKTVVLPIMAIDHCNINKIFDKAKQLTIFL